MPDFQIALPNELNYSSVLPSLPSGVQSLEQYLLPVNGSTFNTSVGGTVVQWDLPARGFLVPNSMYIRYFYTLTNSGALVSTILGTPVYAPIQKLETIFGSQTVESINNYNQTMNMITNLSMNVGQKYGVQNAYGWFNNTGTPTLDSLDGRACVVNETGSFSAPLFGLLANSERYLPLGMMPNVRLQITLDKLTNFFQQNNLTAAVQESPSQFAITNFELCFTMLDFGSAVESMVKNMGETIVIKSQSFTNTSNTISIASTGYQELVFSQRLASIKSFFILNPITGTTTYNGLFDSYDITKGGSWQIGVGGKYYPQKVLDTTANKSAIYMELRKAVGAINSNNNNFSINTIEFNRVVGVATSVVEPAKFFVGVNMELLPDSKNSLLTGTSTQNTPITVRLNIASATAATSASVTLLSLYDALIEINPADRQATVRQ